MLSCIFHMIRRSRGGSHAFVHCRAIYFGRRVRPLRYCIRFSLLTLRQDDRRTSGRMTCRYDETLCLST